MKLQKMILGLIILAASTALVVSLPSGLLYCSQTTPCARYFWGAHEHDGIWHLAVIETILNKYPFELPVMSGHVLSGYNYLLDIVIAIASRISHIDAHYWYFQIIPVGWFVGMILLLLAFARRYRPTPTYPIFLLILTFFGSSLGYLITLWNMGTINGSSSILSMQPMQNLLNLQFALSLIPLLFVMIGLTKSKQTLRDYGIYALCLFIGLGLKFYTGAVIGILLGYEIVSGIIATRRVKSFLLPTLLVATATLLAYSIFYYSSTPTGSPLIWKPLATVRPIIEDSTLFYWPSMANRLYSSSWIVSSLANMIALLLFVLFNFGTRLFGLLGMTKKDRVTYTPTQRIIVVGIITSLLLSILFVQAGVWWNTVQFLYVSLFLTGVLAADGLDRLWRTHIVAAKIFVIATILLTLPANMDIFRTYATFPGSSYISQPELDVLARLRAEGDGVVFVPLFAKQPATELPARYDTAYVSAYTGKQTYLADVIQLELTQVSYDQRRVQVANFDCEVLTHVTYLYERSDNPYTIHFEKCGASIEKVFGNETASYYRVR